MIVVTKGKARAEFPDHLLAEVCLQVCGGGWATSQTANALIMQHTLRDTGKARIKNVRLELVPNRQYIPQHFNEYDKIVDRSAVTGDKAYITSLQEGYRLWSHDLDAPSYLPMGCTMKYDAGHGEKVFGFYYGRR